MNFLGFDVYKTGSTVDLEWTTANEVNTLFFEIERSSDGLNFSNIDTVNSKNIGQKNKKIFL